ncbi:hypothetical protein [Shewanella frigidimarina]|uniref:hypothetical protein n=1 Tax=Shewanella frigidimarina TaxID=56812 RepID=UPI003D7A195F
MNYLCIAEKHDLLLKNLADIALMQRVISSSFKREFETISEYEKQNSASEIISHDAFGAYSLITGSIEKYAFRETSISDLKNLTIWNKNNQYCWLLVNVYEKFEKFIFEVHENLAGCEIDKPNLRKALTFISNKHLSIRSHEKNNSSNIHLKVAIILIEKCRHKIVHAQGHVADIKEFTDKIISDSGVNNNKKIHEEFIMQFIQDGKIFILEQPINDGHRIPRYRDVYTHLISYLIGYANLIKQAEIV